MLQAMQYCPLDPDSAPSGSAAVRRCAHCDQGPLRLLVVQDDPREALLWHRLVTSGVGSDTLFSDAHTLEQTREALRALHFDAIVLDASLLDARGTSLISAVLAAAAQTPIVVVGRDSDEEQALEALRCGVQDYLLESRLDGPTLSRAILYAIERVDHARQLVQQAHFDELTGLANRLLLFDRITHALEHAQRHHESLALLFLDLDHFKSVNDGLGHAMGDKLLQVVAARIEQVVRQCDTIAVFRHDQAATEVHTAARLGGDEFAILLENVSDRSTVERVAERLLSVLREPVTLDGHCFVPTTSIGIASYPENGTTREALLECADAAMYRAKRLGRDGYQLGTEAPPGQAARRA